jgi:hypothetical protein
VNNLRLRGDILSVQEDDEDLKKKKNPAQW